MPEPVRHLQIVDENGVVHDSCPNCAGAEKEVRAWRVRYANLARDVEAGAKAHARWPEGLALFRYWQEKCNHPRSEFTAARFELVLPYLQNQGPEACREAIRGAAFDPYVTRRKNGTEAVHNGWELIFRSQAKVEEFQARAPVERQPFRKAWLEDHAAEVAKRVSELGPLLATDDPGSIATTLAGILRLQLRWLDSA